MKEHPSLARYIPALRWIRGYNRGAAGQDLLAAMIITLMVIPQSLAYAMLAGMPPVAGLYASILPLLAYALLGTSRVLAVGPVAVTALLTASVLTPMFAPGSPQYVAAALLLAAMSGVLLVAMSLLRLGFLANFLSHPVTSGFVSAAGILITLDQFKHIFGIQVSGGTAFDKLLGLLEGLSGTQLPTLLIGAGSLIFLLLMRRYGSAALARLGLSEKAARMLARAAPLVALAVTATIVYLLRLDASGVAVVGAIPGGLPPLTLPAFSVDMLTQLLPSAILISFVGFVGSVSVAQTFAARCRERIEPNQELIALGAANLVASFSGGLPVSGGFSRSVINYDAGARTPMAGALSALGICIIVLFFTSLFEYLPRAVLAATIIVAVLSLVDLKALKRTWRYSQQDGIAMLATMLGVLLLGIEQGILIGVVLSLVLFLWRTSHPHIAVVGLLPGGSQHFRNIERFNVVQSPSVLSIRVDESLYFPNARYLEDRIAELVGNHPKINHLVLICSGVNLVDASALASLETINERLLAAGIHLHLSEVKGPVMDHLHGSEFLQRLSGEVFISQYQALATLDPDTVAHAEHQPPSTQPMANKHDAQAVSEIINRSSTHENSP